MAVLSGLRSALSFLLVLVWLVVAGNIMLFGAVLPAGALRPRRRRAYVSAYMRLMSRGFVALLRLGGARFERSGTLPTDGPALILMNHQSLLDIPTLVLMSWPYAPAFVTRTRYAHLPPVSTCVRAVGSPTIDPRRDPQAAVDLMRRMAPGLAHGVVLFAEGHRTRDGAVRPFKTAGAQALLDASPMPVWLVATDGLWSSRRLVDFVLNVHRIRARTEVIGRWAPPARGEDVPAFMGVARGEVAARVEKIRAGASAVPDSVRDLVRERALQPASPEAAAAAAALAQAAQGEVDAIVFFGSRRSGARPEPGSAYDFFVVVADERRFYQALRGQGLVGRRP
ncbi:MAG TPA: lysophospholipid acyltransferase family protein, partial [Vicinamibacteria bacterium]|nr:lysophospholipid acyltransferase family protein [Vicinamibacteria bacterium]